MRRGLAALDDKPPGREKPIKESEREQGRERRDRAYLVGLETPRSRWPLAAHMAELAELARSAGAEVVGEARQARPSPDRTYAVGRGKVEETRAACEILEADLVIFAVDLSPVQLRNLEEALGRRVVDRTQLILDIFAQRAQSREGKLQVELAQLNYLLPRLTGFGQELSRLGGGIGTRGPGETKLETDRRRIRLRIAALHRELDEVRRHRATLRGGREASGLPLAALVGYTNAGKSTLLNGLSGATVLAEDQLFATLDPTTRRVDVPGRGSFLLSDTVGFLHDLPHHLVAAFRATLEEVRYADVLVHVVDASHPQAVEQLEAVHEVLKELEADETPTLLVFNKIDRLTERANPDGLYLPLPGRRPAAWVNVSARTGEGLDRLLEELARLLWTERREVHLLLPYDRGDLLALAHDRGQVYTEQYRPEGVELRAELPGRLADRLEAAGRSL